MTRQERGKILARAVWQLLGKHKSLLFFPALGYSCKYAIFAAIIVPFANRHELHLLHERIPVRTTGMLIVAFSLLLFFVNAVLFFFNAAIVENLLAYFKQQQTPSIAFGFIRAIKRYLRVFSWLLFASLYGICINLLPKNGEYFQRTRRYLHHNHWQIASQFGLIYALDTPAWPIAAFEASCTLVAKTWGTHLRQNYALSGLFILCRLLAFVPLILASLLGGHLPLFIGSGITLACMLAVSTIAQLTYTTIRVASYCYTQHQITPQTFSTDLLRNLYIPS